MKIKPGKGWTFAVHSPKEPLLELDNWVFQTRLELDGTNYLDCEVKPVHVAIVPMKEYRAMKKELERLRTATVGPGSRWLRELEERKKGVRNG